jgi:hypothetical protein
MNLLTILDKVFSECNIRHQPLFIKILVILSDNLPAGVKALCYFQAGVLGGAEG